MLALRLDINGKNVCVAGADSVLSAIATVHGNQLSKMGTTLTIKGSTENDTALATWLDQQIAVGDEVRLQVVDVPESEITRPSKISRTNQEIAKREEENYYRELKKKYEPKSV